MSRLLLYCACLIFGSCHTQTHYTHAPLEDSKAVIRLNFYDDITELNPDQTHNDTERLVCELIYEPLYWNDSNRNIQSTFIDSIYQKDSDWYLTVNPITYNHSVLLDATDLKNSLMNLLNDDRETLKTKEFFEAIEGFSFNTWNRANSKDLAHSLDGIEILNQNTIRFKWSRKNSDFVSSLRSLDLIVRDSIYGTGSYYISDLVADISCVLTPRDSTWNGVNLKFIKNEDLKIKDFLDGNLDIITYCSSSSKSKSYSTYMEETISNQYSDYQSIRTNRSVVTVAIIDTQDSLHRQLIERILLCKTQECVDNIHTLANRDSINLYQNKIVDPLGIVSLKLPFASRYDSLQLTPINIIQQYSEVSQDGTCCIDLPQSAFLIAESPEYYIVHRNIVGIKPYMNWKQVLYHARFVEPSIY